MSECFDSVIETYPITSFLTVLSELYQKRLISEDDLRCLPSYMMQYSSRHWLDSLVHIQSFKSDDVCARTFDTLRRFSLTEVVEERQTMAKRSRRIGMTIYYFHLYACTNCVICNFVGAQLLFIQIVPVPVLIWYNTVFVVSPGLAYIVKSPHGRQTVITVGDRFIRKMCGEASSKLLYLECQIDSITLLLIQMLLPSTSLQNECMPQLWGLLRSGHLHLQRGFLRSGEGCQSVYLAKVCVTCLVHVPHSVTTYCCLLRVMVLVAQGCEPKCTEVGVVTTDQL